MVVRYLARLVLLGTLTGTHIFSMAPNKKLAMVERTFGALVIWLNQMIK
jgi:hypothetical protein